MSQLSRPDIEAAFRDYAGQVAVLRQEAEDSVVAWTYADDWPFGLHPLFAEADAEGGTDVWKQRKLKWGPKESFAQPYAQGADDQRRVRIVDAYGRFARIYLYGDGFIDELRLRGQELVVLQRAAVEEGMVRTIRFYTLRPHQTHVERYEYTNGRCVRSVRETEYVAEGEWRRASWQTICDFEYDDQGLVRAYEDQPGLSDRKLVFLRRAPRSKPKPKKVRPRPLVAYVVDATTSDAGPEHAVYCDVYGLEMTYDDDLPLDVVPFIPTQHVSIIFGSTDVTNDGTVYAGAIPESDSPNFEAIAETGATWTVLNAEDAEAPSRVAAAWSAGLNVLIVAENEERLAKTLGEEKPSGPERLAVAFRPKRPVAPSTAQTGAKKMRAALTAMECGDSRIILASGSLKSDLEEYIAKPDVDGFYLEKGGFAAAVELCEQISMRRAEEGDG